ncbi:ARM repeat-containing protein [Yamadazyma tenuis ATCC 10573]|uniref:Nucleolar protein 9 n=1 Tax=Candida tenuis (strain ATCC 10573 / BCRC 21748 / CBS 615 / JCM 9827 / NBRC 10315 / NRRL Y-1498 / VKM Y-70) TaxID=590646 RepID=G3BFA4_CANTC|nr:ARM repeat-containing protein [Yamadazyma tenuis ATCC 10573]EGV60009.1 ARM repeat-containing protein [Yamadazyma tenuis ATCC 10573]
MGSTKIRGRRTQKKAQEENSKDLGGAVKPTFFGLVDSSEIDYFKQAESTLNINAFDSDEERDAFVRSVLEECKGKELKLVTNQICSKLMERLLLIGTDRQAKHIFKNFSGHLASLAHHKYSSHVLETLLVRITSIIEKELIGDEHEEDTEEEEDPEIDQVTTEQLFLKMMNEFHPHIQQMMEHQYASHVLRLVILIASGKELPSSTVSNSTLRSKKSKIARKMIEIKDNEIFNRAFQVPPSFKDEVKKICKAIVEGQDITRMRQLSIHKIASPVIQLLLQVEGIVDKDRAIWHSIFLKEKDGQDSKEEAYVEYLLSDPVGSHFLESLIKNTGVRMKYIERLYKLYMKERVLKLAKRSNTGVFIIQALMFKLKPGEVQYILDQIIPELSSLISISENQNLELSTKVIDASIQNKNYRRDEIIEQLFNKFAPNYDFKEPDDVANAELLENILQLTKSTLGNTRDDWPTAEERRRSLLLEKFMQYDYSFVICVWYNFLALPVERFLQMCTHGVFSHVVENSLTVLPASITEPKPTSILRKRFLNLFQSHIVRLSINSYGSHIVDKLWHFTILLNMYKDRIGSELQADSHKVKESKYGKLVWKNWSMELFMRKKYDWKTLIKEQEQQYYSETGQDNQDQETRIKKPIELKLEKMHKEKLGREANGLKSKNAYEERQNKKRKF